MLQRDIHTRLFIYLSIHLSIYLSIYFSIYLSIYLSIYVSMLQLIDNIELLPSMSHGRTYSVIPVSFRASRGSFVLRLYSAAPVQVREEEPLNLMVSYGRLIVLTWGILVGLLGTKVMPRAGFRSSGSLWELLNPPYVIQSQTFRCQTPSFHPERRLKGEEGPQRKPKLPTSMLRCIGSH